MVMQLHGSVRSKERLKVSVSFSSLHTYDENDFQCKFLKLLKIPVSFCQFFHHHLEFPPLRSLIEPFCNLFPVYFVFTIAFKCVVFFFFSSRFKFPSYSDTNAAFSFSTISDLQSSISKLQNAQ